MRKKIFANMCLTSLITVVLTTLLITAVYYGDFEARMKEEVRAETGYVQTAIEQAGPKYINELSNIQNRITIIESDGTVLFDNHADPASMENHSERPEVVRALTGGAGEDTRISNTLSKQTFYYAVKLEGGQVLRVASTTDTVLSALLSLLPWVLAAGVAAAVITAVFSSLLTKNIVAPINRLDLDNPEENVIYEEFSPLLTRIGKQNQIIAEQIRSLKEKQEEFASITENMNEGFLVLDRSTDILSYNTGALTLLGADPSLDLSRQSAFSLNRSPSFRTAVDAALSGAGSQQLLREKGRCCRIMANPVFRNSEVEGAVVVIMDITEQEERENLRREFTANVSHELKTPLTSISGFAEIIQNGIAKPQDIPRFAGNIFMESQRLVALVDDIIKLSRLDEEDGLLERELIVLKDMCQNIASRIKPAADKMELELTVEGDSAEIRGVKSIVDEMIFNLFDNAVKYNKKGGQIAAYIASLPQGVSLTVEDTGIGIPLPDQSRVFERFYRVDKSHSKEIGGTGLGLSIVKHGAAFHNARLSLASTEGKGTKITMIFPHPSK